MDLQMRQTVFSDEKRFTLDVPNSNRYYFYDLRKEDLTFCHRQNDGVGVMIWAFIMHGMKSDIVFVPTTLNSVSYQDLLEEHLIPLKHKLWRKKWYYQQDNAPSHASCLSMK